MTKTNTEAEGRLVVFYQAAIQVNTPTLTLLVDVLRQARLRSGSRWRILSDQQAALIVLAVLRHDQRPADLAAAYQISHSTVRRRVFEAITGLAPAPHAWTGCCTGPPAGPPSLQNRCCCSTAH